LAAENSQNNFFDTEHLKADLKGRSVRGGAVTMAAQGAQFFLHLGSTVVLARLLKYEGAIERQFYKAIDQLERLQRLRKGDAVPAPVNINLAVDTENRD